MAKDAEKQASSTRGIRLNPRHQDMVRQKIRASMLINHLQRHATGKREMTQSQIQAAKILLDKAVPNLHSSEVKGDVGPVLSELMRRALRVDPEPSGS